MSNVDAISQEAHWRDQVPTSKPLLVVVVDDELAIGAIVRRYLEGDPVDVTVFATGKEALDFAATTAQLDLLITDVMMPDLQGHELAQRLRQRDRDLRVLYLTGHADHLFEAKQQLWDREAFLEKPFSKQALRQAVAQLMFGRTVL
jgi:two-component system cell cycle sensor histidine kinase/response regulator CckA